MNHSTESAKSNPSIRAFPGNTDSAVDIRWIVCEDGNENRWRWTETLRASIDGLFLNHRMIVQPALPDQGLSLAMQCQKAGQSNIVVVWSVTPKALMEQCRRITMLQTSNGSGLQIAATSSIPEKYQIMLSEFGASLQVQQPEDLQAIVKAIGRRLGFYSKDFRHRM
ncbi:hypothetical protein Q31b_16230 [Novipirellula aureliae]|uniref:Uncharacterized protein n=1 Tax=Novipirellula aureliae TaxID=2527966 RepID=A0A5C6E5G0_9BACT|nr:hypothetical protein [Novipirellula aureliae]TWU44088.1 hypothetical protein Q31b_16230 [Novipirellula aureliae]